MMEPGAVQKNVFKMERHFEMRCVGDFCTQISRRLRKRFSKVGLLLNQPDELINIGPVTVYKVIAQRLGTPILFGPPEGPHSGRAQAFSTREGNLIRD